jgi:hypothetical protein
MATISDIRQYFPGIADTPRKSIGYEQNRTHTRIETRIGRRVMPPVRVEHFYME